MSDHAKKLTRSAERLSRSQPGRYKLNLLFFALLGYAVIFGSLFCLLAILGGMIWLIFVSAGFLLLLVKTKLIFVVIPLTWVLLRALWVRLEAPDGHQLTRKQYPNLFREIDVLSKKLQAPKIHRVILNGEFNAGIVQTQRLGIFGWNQNTLILGLELLLVLSRDQARAVIAHELGHLSGNHSRFHGWIYRIRLSWYRIMVAFSQHNNIGANLMSRFFQWYYPRFDAYSFVLARQNEYEADAISVELTNPEIAADALVNVYVSAPYVNDNYWTKYFKKADTRPEPGFLPWQGLSQFLHKSSVAAMDLQQGLAEQLKLETTYDDTHPALVDRLQAIGVKPSVPKPTMVTAAKAWFGKEYDRTLASFDEQWLQDNKQAWRERYEYVSESVAALKQLNTRANDDLNDEDLWQKAVLTEEFIDSERATALYRAYQTRHPKNADVAFILGRLAYDRKDDELLKQMSIALVKQTLAVEACRYAYFYLQEQQRFDEAKFWYEQGTKSAEIDEYDEMERSMFLETDELIEHTLDKDVIRHIRHKLRASKKVKKAWIAQKKTKHNTDIPAIAIAFESKGVYLSEESLSEKIVESLGMNVSIFMVPVKGEYKHLAKKIVRMNEQIL